MKRLICVVVSLFGFAAGSLVQAQTSDANLHRSNTQILDYIISLQEKRILEVAEVMPAAKYAFAPTQGEFKGVHTFAEQLKHIAADNYLLGAGILGEKAPVDVGRGESGSTALRTKLEIIAYVRASFTYMHRAAASLDDANAPIPTPAISPWPRGTATRLGVAVEDCLHTWDHYGQLVEYLRMNGIVPPESRR
jgi:DinB superfamily